MNKRKTLRVAKSSDIEPEEDPRIGYTKGGTKYYRHSPEFPSVKVYTDFHINIDRLNLLERFCDVAGYIDLRIFVRDAIYEKADREMRNPDLERITRRIRQDYLEKWDVSIQNRPDLQSHLSSC